MHSDAAARLRRIARQQLESLLRAGLTHLPATAPPDPPRAASLPVASAAERPAAAPTAPAAAPAAAILFAETQPTQAGVGERSPAATVPNPSPLPLAERCRVLEEVAGRVAACRRCQELADTRTQTVFGVGDPQARILFIGEAPGADEDRQGEPFVGKAGQLLNKIIAACRLKREDVYICNILKCRPPNNRTPTAGEAAHCREYLDAQLATVDPEYIVCWGSVAAQTLLGTTQSVGRLRGQFHTHGRAKVLCTYHPSYLLRYEPAKKDVWQDMKFLMRDLGVEL